MAEQERIEIPGVLESVLRYSLKDAQERMEKGEVVVPFSALAVGETLFMEEHNFDTPEECFADARHTVEHATGAAAYGLCYDGYVETDAGKKDALIAQGGVPGDEYGHAIGVLYTIDEEGKPHFEDEPIYVGNCLNYMVGLSPEDDYRLDEEGENTGDEVSQDGTSTEE